MTKPYRVQLSRKAGWRRPDNTVVVGRPTAWGNPFPIGKIGREEAVKRFRAMLDSPAEMANWLYPPLSKIREKLRGRNLACWCRLDEPCHADVLLEIANAPDEEDRQ